MPLAFQLLVFCELVEVDFTLKFYFFSYRLYELNVNDANEIDWEDLASAR